MKYSFLILSILVFSCSSKDTVERPNIIVIMADDLGYGDVGAYGAKPENVKTPNIDKLAEGGLKFTSGYCSASTCTPTRYSFLTGSYAFRKKGTGIAPPNAPAIIKPGTETIASLLQKSGYKTAVIGKWHLGLGGPEGPDWNGELNPGPREIGFDYNFLLPTTNDRVPQVYVENHRVRNLDPNDPLWVGRKKPSENHPTGITHRNTLKMNWNDGHNNTIHNGIGRIGFYTGGHAARFRDEDLADEWQKQSNQWIEDNKDNPFFLFFSSHDIHVPRMPHERFQGQSGMSFRGDAIVQLDWNVGEIMKTLDRLNLTENTLIIFVSDNGPVLDDGYDDFANEALGNHKPAGPYSGGKYTVREGGTRTPFITYWKGKIQPGVSDEMISTIDLAASMAALTGVPLPKDGVLDSFNVLGALLGKDGAKGRNHIVSQDNGLRGTYGLRVGEWKLQRHDAKKMYNGDLSMKLWTVPEYALFNLNEDIGELNDVSQDHPQVVERLKSKLQTIIIDGRSRN
ncbi:MAG: arylsulfatase [Candidatus Marinimicrobia bacterium]|jgi:arylsulfatase A|nr:arylsulfatase [Candidatus Neomarinimicrobiota bacterium]MBT3675976.1 arylsulfatase [Candidatus Neomarinimicrobiota bacterium]MBT3764117.1 arylsulfatase [Candidatus Neomarinimicrobiota bacterium]MBT4069308.1 arylsulfatase [Candidatus Neomarinimicrobiota bacterium]MBT4270466.1 arylsulfatase [Candidatus Neomarinimicrobiota bacterium]